MDDNLFKELMDRYAEEEKEVVKELVKCWNKIDKIEGILKKQELLIKEALPLKIRGLVLMEKSNLIAAIMLGNTKKYRDILGKHNPNKLKEIWKDVPKNCRKAGEATRGEWKQINEIIDDQVRILRLLGGG